MPEPTIVWMVRLGPGVPPDDVRGKLRLGATALEFDSARPGGDARIDYADILRTKRIRGSPVLLIDHEREGDKQRTAFYFAQPPPLTAPAGSPTSVPPGPLTPFRRAAPTKRQVTRMNLGYLRSTSVANGGLLREWERAVKERAEGR